MEPIIKFREHLHEIMMKYDCIGGWWSYEDKIPEEVKNELYLVYDVDLKTLTSMAHNICQELYSDGKPQPLSSSSSDMQRFYKDYGF